MIFQFIQICSNYLSLINYVQMLLLSDRLIQFNRLLLTLGSTSALWIPAPTTRLLILGQAGKTYWVTSLLNISYHQPLCFLVCSLQHQVWDWVPSTEKHNCQNTAGQNNLFRIVSFKPIFQKREEKDRSNWRLNVDISILNTILALHLDLLLDACTIKPHLFVSWLIRFC